MDKRQKNPKLQEAIEELKKQSQKPFSIKIAVRKEWDVEESCDNCGALVKENSSVMHPFFSFVVLNVDIRFGLLLLD